ncbi:MAG: phosphatidylglycerophosphatase A family protein [Enterobacteriaceae bacterium]
MSILKKFSKNSFYIEEIAFFIVTGFKIGTLFSRASGTVASILAMPIWYLFLSFSKIYYFILIIFFFLLGLIFCDIATNKIIKIKDDKRIVIDEFIGMWISLIFVNNLTTAIIGLFIFRILDITKPYPLKFIDSNIKNGFGIIVDDIFAGIISSLILKSYEFIKFLIVL